jgi:hypothetical protein
MSNENEPNCEISLESMKSSDFDPSSEIDKNDDESDQILLKRIRHNKFSYSLIITGEEKIMSECALQGIAHYITEVLIKKICNKWYELFETNQIDLSGNHKVEGQMQTLKHKKKYNKRGQKKKSKETQNVKKCLQKNYK